MHLRIYFAIVFLIISLTCCTKKALPKLPTQITVNEVTEGKESFARGNETFFHQKFYHRKANSKALEFLMKFH